MITTNIMAISLLALVIIIDQYLEKNPFDYYVLSNFNQEEYTPNALSTAPIIPFENSSLLFEEQKDLNQVYDSKYISIFFRE